MDEQVPPYLQLCVMLGLGMDMAWLCGLYLVSVSHTIALKAPLPGAEAAGSTGLLSQLSGSRPHKCFRAALLTACSASTF